MKTIGYVRVSTDKQADRGVSLEAQAEKIRAMAVVHNAELLDIIVDGGESAKSLKRPGMARLLALVDAGEGPDRHRRQARPAHQEREGFVHPAGAVRAPRRSPDLGGRIPGHWLGRRAPGAEHHDGGEPMGTRGHRRADAGRHEPQTYQRRAGGEHPVRLPAWAATGSTLSPIPPNRKCFAKSTTCVGIATPCGELRPRSTTRRFVPAAAPPGGWSTWRES